MNALFCSLSEIEYTRVMYNRFNGIIVSLQNLCKDLGSDAINRKWFASFPIKWRPKITTIEDAKKLKIIIAEELLGSLITHEHT